MKSRLLSINLFTIIGLFTLSLVFTSCKKEEAVTPLSPKTASIENNKSQLSCEAATSETNVRHDTAKNSISN